MKQNYICKFQTPHVSMYLIAIINKYHTGITTGIINNIIVLDIDIKRNGEKELNKYFEEFGHFNTLTIKTPSGGYHYYFKYDTKNILLSFLKNFRDLRGASIDIRTTGGYVKGPPSPNYTIINNVEMVPMPDSLIYWLLIGKINFNEEEKKEKPIKTNTTTHKPYNIQPFKFKLNKEQLETILYQLDKENYINFYKWGMVLNCLKNFSLNNFDTWEMFDKWSKQSKTNYDKEQNKLLWNASNAQIDINYLIYVLNKEKGTKTPYIEKYKADDIKLNLKGFTIDTINEKHLNFTLDTIKQNDTIIIKSTTGTGKTTRTAEILKEYTTENPQYKIISIVNLIKLSEQQQHTFKKKGILLKNYQNNNSYELLNNNFVVCLNSLVAKLSNTNEDDIKNFIIYIDEINSFIETLLFNDTLNDNLKATTALLNKLVKNCHKLILSDAHINNNVFNLLEKRDKPNKIFINNLFKKYEGVEGIKYNDENLYFKELQAHIKDDNYFLCGSDSKTTITQYYNKLLELFPDKKDKFILITLDTNKTIKNASKEFKDKFVFYSPTIITGVDVSLEAKQDVFIIIKGKTISPEASFQQTTRTRNINKLFYYSSATQKDPKYSSLDELRTHLKEKIIQNDKIINVSTNYDEDDELVVIENLFFKLYSYGLYLQDVQQTNKLIHYENILINEGFKLSEVGTPQKLNKELQDEIKDMTDEQLENQFKEFKNYITDDNYIYQSNEEFKILEERQEQLFIFNEELDKYKFLLLDRFNINSFYTVANLFKNDEYLKSKYDSKKKLSMNEKIINDNITKILMLRKFEKSHQIEPFDIEFTNSKPILNTDETEFKHINKLFSGTKKQPQTIDELKTVYIGYVRHLTGKLKLIDSKKIRVGDKTKYKYTFNTELLNDIFTLYFRQNQANFDEKRMKIFNIIEPPQEPVYLFGKN